ncbi:MAG: DUF1177 domain-containing protein [Acidimicrobiia bacterium]
MALNQVLTAMRLLDGPVKGDRVAEELEKVGVEVSIETVIEQSGSTDFLLAKVSGDRGRSVGGDSPTLGIVGRLGGIGARPGVAGLVSDGDGAVAAIAVALKLGQRASQGDPPAADVVIATHICPNAPTEPHEPVPFMGSPVEMATMNRLEVSDEMEAVLVIDTTKGNRIINWKGIAITPTVLQGWVLPVAPDLLDVYEHVCGIAPRVLPVSTYDITPYGNGLYHVNSILQPAVATGVPVVGVAITAETAVPGSAANSSHPSDIALAASFCLESAARFAADRLTLYDPDMFAVALERYGSMSQLQTIGSGGTVK